MIFDSYLLLVDPDGTTSHALVDKVDAADLDAAADKLIRKLVGSDGQNYGAGVVIDDSEDGSQQFLSFNDGAGPSFVVCPAGASPQHD